jgi:N-acetylmuramoyl-L-alanine amidase
MRESGNHGQAAGLEVRVGRVAALGFLLTGGIALAQGSAPAGHSDIDDVISKVLQQAEPEKGAKAETPIVIGARVGEEKDRTRFVIELSDPVPIRTFLLSGPNRIVIDMPAVQWHLDPMRERGVGAVKSYRYGLFRSENSRFVIDLTKPVTLSDALVLPPERGYGYRVVIDLFPTTQAKFDEAAGWPQDLKAKETAAEHLASLAPVPRKTIGGAGQRKVVIIDPGHGGLDSGTNGVNGLLEKDVVLDAGLRLARTLEKSGSYIVHLTRDSDIYVPLSERVGIARSWHADLFISLHADSNPDSSVSGLSIYTLSSSASDREAAALARKENQSDVIAGVDLGGENSQVAPILIDLAQRDTLNRSSRFALTALDRLSNTTDILGRDPHRSAGFVVLKAPDVPAVLIELGYLSNARDAARMATASWRDGVANAIAAAVERQFSTQAALEPLRESTP